MRTSLWSLAFAAGLLTGVAPSFGQFSQYTPPGPPSRPEPLRESLERSAKEARWGWGAWRVDTVFGLSDLAYRKAEGETDRWSTTLTVGAQGYWKWRSSLFAAYALPGILLDYSADLESSWLDRYGLGWFLRLGRLELETVGKRTESFERVSWESPARFRSTGDEGRLSLAVPITSRLFWTAGFTTSTVSYGSGENRSSLARQLDRRQKTAETGFRFKLSDRLELLLFGRKGEVRFSEDSPRGADLDLEGWGMDLSWRRPKSGLSLRWEQSRLQFLERPVVGSVSGSTAQAKLFWQPRSRFGLSLYGQRQWAFPLLRVEPVSVETRRGVALELGVTERLKLSLFSEQGELGSLVGPASTDDFQAQGARISFPLGRMRASVGYRRLQLEAGFSRSYRVSEWIGGLSLGLKGPSGPPF